MNGNKDDTQYRMLHHLLQDVDCGMITGRLANVKQKLFGIENIHELMVY